MQRILRAAAELVDTLPLEEITMAVIAKAAGASFSSIYRFFPSKEAILDDVVMAYLDKLQAEYENFFAHLNATSDGETLIHKAIDIYVAFIRREPGFKALWLQGAPNPEIQARFHNVNLLVVGLAKAYGIGQLGMQDSPGLDLRLQLAMEATTHLLRFAFSQSTFNQDQVIDELKRLLKASLLILV